LLNSKVEVIIAVMVKVIITQCRTRVVKYLKVQEITIFKQFQVGKLENQELTVMQHQEIQLKFQGMETAMANRMKKITMLGEIAMGI